MRLLAAAATLTVAACADPAAPLDAEFEPIVNGTDDGGRDPSVVLLVGTISSTQGILCTGTITTPRVVLTAAHCVAPSAGATSYKVDFVESWDTQTNQLTGVTDPRPRTVAKIWFDPLFDETALETMNAGHDVALVLLDSAVVSTLAPQPLYRSRLTKRRRRPDRSLRRLRPRRGRRDHLFRCG